MGVTTGRISMDRHAILGQPVFTSGRKTMHNRRTSAAAALAAAALAVALTGCGDPKTDPTPSPSPSTSPTASPSTPEDQAKVDAQAALDRYFEVSNRVSQDPKVPLSEFKSVAVGFGLSAAQHEYRQNREKGIVSSGDAKYELIKVKSLSLDNSDPKKGKVPSVAFVICWDLTAVEGTDGNGKPVDTSKRMDRSEATYSIANYDYSKDPRGGWKVTGTERKMEKSC